MAESGPDVKNLFNRRLTRDCIDKTSRERLTIAYGGAQFTKNVKFSHDFKTKNANFDVFTISIFFHNFRFF